MFVMWLSDGPCCYCRCPLLDVIREDFILYLTSVFVFMFLIRPIDLTSCEINEKDLSMHHQLGLSLMCV